MFTALPVLMVMSWVPAQAPAVVPATTETQSASTATQAGADTIKCPMTGEEIPSCCCPVKK